MNDESKVFGMNARTFSATFIIVCTTLVLCYQAVERGDDSNLVLFGKAAGAIEAKKEPPKTP